MDCCNQFERIEQKKWELVHDKKFILANDLIDLECHLAMIKNQIGDFVEAKRGVLLEKDTLDEKRTSQNSWRYFTGDVYRYEMKNTFSWLVFGKGFKEGPKVEAWYKGRRILLRRLMNRAHRLMATLATGAFVTNKNLYILKPKTEGVDLRWILGIVNSRLYSHLYSSRVSGAVKDDFPQVTLADFLALPCPATAWTSGTTAPDVEIVTVPTRIAALVDQVLAAKARDGNADTSSLEAEIDQLVYKLYGLTDEEIAIVEGNGMSNAETQRKASPPPASPRKRGKSAAVEPMEDEVLE